MMPTARVGPYRPGGSQREYNLETKGVAHPNIIETAGGQTRIPVSSVPVMGNSNAVAGTHNRQKMLENGSIVLQRTQVFHNYGQAVRHRGDYHHPGGPIFDVDGTILGYRELPGWFIDGYKWQWIPQDGMNAMPPLSEWLEGRPHSDEEFEWDTSTDAPTSSDVGSITPDL